MSLIGIRRERKQGSGGPTRPPALWKLVVGLAVVGLVIWYLSRYG